MGIKFQDITCELCGNTVQVCYAGNYPTIRDFHDVAFLKNCDGQGKHVCYECESQRMEDTEDE